MALSLEEKRKINAALTESNGDRQRACEILGITQSQLKKLIRQTADLKKLWSQGNVVPTRKDVTRGPEDCLGLAVAEMESPAVRNEREEAEFGKLMESIGLNPGDVTEAMALQKFYGNHIGRAMNLIGGGVTKRALKLMRWLEDLDGRFAKGFAGEDADATLAQWTFAYIEGHKVLAALLNSSALSATARAKIALYQSQISGGSKGKGKAGFGPKTLEMRPA